MRGDAGDVLFTVEHDPGVLTAGRRARAEHILATPRELADYGVEMHAIERGGGWTWHGPGQLVGYPIIMLDEARGERDLHWVLRQLEEAVITVLGCCGLEAERKPRESRIQSVTMDGQGNLVQGGGE